MVFCFTFFTYNGQRIIRLKYKSINTDFIGDRLQWVLKNKNVLIFFSALAGLTGSVCIFFINIKCWIILIPMGILSAFYVIPLGRKSPTLRELPYIKIFIISMVWSLIIVWIPFFDTGINFNDRYTFYLGLLQVFMFIIAITLPFDVRDIEFDIATDVKTIPRLLGIKNTILFSELLLLGSLITLYMLNINIYHFYALTAGHLITMLMILFTNKKRKELFYTGLIEGSVLILYVSVIIADCFSFL